MFENWLLCSTGDSAAASSDGDTDCWGIEQTFAVSQKPKSEHHQRQVHAVAIKRDPE